MALLLCPTHFFASGHHAVGCGPVWHLALPHPEHEVLSHQAHDPQVALAQHSARQSSRDATALCLAMSRQSEALVHSAKAQVEGEGREGEKRSDARAAIRILIFGILDI